jgi:hypothetical protein
MDTAGTVRYENFFLWDISYDTMTRDRSRAEAILRAAKIIVLTIPYCGNERNIARAIEWCQGHVSQAQRVIVAITQCDKPEEGHIRPRDRERISAEWQCAVVGISGANVPSESRHRLDPTIRNLVLAIDDCVTSLRV